MEKISLESALEGLARGEGLATLTAVNDTLENAGRFKSHFTATTTRTSCSGSSPGG